MKTATLSPVLEVHASKQCLSFCIESIDNIFKEIDCLMARTACLVCLVSNIIVAAAKTHSAKRALVARTKQSKKVKKADELTRQAG